MTSRDKVDCRSIHGAAPLFYIQHAYILPPLRVSLSRFTSPPSQSFFSFFLFVFFLSLSLSLSLFLSSLSSLAAARGVAYQTLNVFPWNPSWTSWTRNRSDLVPCPSIVIDVPRWGCCPSHRELLFLLRERANNLCFVAWIFLFFFFSF